MIAQPFQCVSSPRKPNNAQALLGQVEVRPGSVDHHPPKLFYCRDAAAIPRRRVMKRIGIGLVLILAVSGWTKDKVEPLNVKLGQWKVVTKITTSGELPLPPEALTRLTPEQRARLEARMKASSGEKTHTITDENCLTRKQLDEGASFGTDRPECVRTVISSSSSKTAMKLACEQDGVKGTGTFEVEARSTENVKGSSQITASGGGHTAHSNSTFTAKWMGPTCSTK
jgi:hypothetical protein